MTGGVDKVYLDTPMGKRIPDSYLPGDLEEIKIGHASLDSSLYKEELNKDIYLNVMEDYDVTYHFATNPETGYFVQQGYLDVLKAVGIPYVLHGDEFWG